MMPGQVTNNIEDLLDAYTVIAWEGDAVSSDQYIKKTDVIKIIEALLENREEEQ